MKLTVLGAGSWGLCLTRLLTRNFEKISLWSREEDLSKELLETKSTRFPYEIKLDDKIEITSNLTEAVAGAEIVLMVVSTAGVRPVAKSLAQSGLQSSQIIVNASKGLELPNLLRMSEVVNQELPKNEFAVLSGPTLAKEVLKELPTAACIACKNIKTADFIQSNFTVADKFRLYSNTDVIGVELGGSLKNVIAIASGFIEAMGLGENARGALLTRGLAEIVRISVEMGAKPSTLYGLSGVGDLIATCGSPLSRNYRVGYLLGTGRKLDDILKELGTVAEGVKTAEAVFYLSKKLGIEAPVSEAVYEAIYTDITPQDAVKKLMSRKLKHEDSYELC